MARRRLNKIDPIRRRDINDLLQNQDPRRPYRGNFVREGELIRPTDPLETILKWHRILTDQEAIDAYAAGQIWESISDNDMRRRDDTPCTGGSATPEPAPSMWGIEIYRYNCGVKYEDKELRYSLIRFPAIKSDADLAVIGTDLKNERVLCWWNSNSGHWEAITGEGGATEAPPAAISCCMEFVQVCDDTPNDCCLMDGIRIHLDATETENFCKPAICFIPIWIWVWQGGLEPGVSFGLPPDHCDWGQLVKAAHTCTGETNPTREVFAISFGPCHKMCPGEEVEVTIVTPVECIAGEHKFTAKCVLQDPIALDGEPGWWGEFTLDGSYPVIGIPIDVEEVELENTVYVVVGCQADLLCQTDQYYVDLGAGYVPYGGTFTPTTNPPTTGTPVAIVDAEGCVLQCSRTYRYGVYFRCDPLTGGLHAGKIYRLHSGGMAQPPTTDDCTIPPTTVPLPTDAIGGGDDVTFDPRGCEPFQVGTIDWDLSTSGETCDIELIGSIPPMSLAGGAPFLYETFGGCLSWQRLLLISPGQPIPACADLPLTEFIEFQFDWSGADECKEQ
jgi:hypothetical protein